MTLSTSISSESKTLPATNISELITAELETTGWYLLKNFRPDLNGQPLNDAFLAVCSQIGVPIGHDRAGALIWDIKNRRTAKGPKAVVTFSEHNHEADLHTDSQYSSYPEDYFALLTLQKARCGGGKSYLLSLKDIIAEMQETRDGGKAVEILSNTEFPFIIPDVFRKKSEREVELNFGPILNGNEIRFRIDTVEKALAYDASLCTEEQVTAFNFLKNLIRNTRRTLRFHLEERDLIFINNKTMLHGRGSFTDNERHLLRVRMNKSSYYK